MVGSAGGRGSSVGIDGAVLEAGVGIAGAVLEASAREAGRGHRDVGDAAPVPVQIERGRRARKNDFADAERMIKRLVAAGTGFELRAGCRPAALANSDAAQVPVDA
jgi:hypothetical protein